MSVMNSFLVDKIENDDEVNGMLVAFPSDFNPFKSIHHSPSPSHTSLSPYISLSNKQSNPPTRHFPLSSLLSIRFRHQFLKETFLPRHPRLLLLLLLLRHHKSLPQLRIRARRHFFIPRVHYAEPRIRLRHHHMLRHKSPFPAKRVLTTNPFLSALFSS